MPQVSWALEPLLRLCGRPALYTFEFFIMNPGLFMDQVFEVQQKADQGVEVRGSMMTTLDHPCLAIIPQNGVPSVAMPAVQSFTPVIRWSLTTVIPRLCVVVDGKQASYRWHEPSR